MASTLFDHHTTALVIETTRVASHIARNDVAFCRSVNPSTAAILDKQKQRLMLLAGGLIQSTTPKHVGFPPSLVSFDDIDLSWNEITEAVDNILEGVDRCLDEYNGHIVRIGEELQQKPLSLVKGHDLKRSRTLRAVKIPKPQLLFDTPVENVSNTIFKPVLARKPHAIFPLEDSLVLEEDHAGLLSYQHPYRCEIEQFDYPQEVYTTTTPVPFMSFETTTARMVDTMDDVRLMLAELKQASVIAVDLEHHDTHSYVGLVSLMQISTRNQDWIVDTLKPWRRELEILNEVFTDPRILKVLHGAHMDIVWLQRDLGLYIVGLFDTHHAARVLGYPGGSLAFLLKKFVDFDAQKQYQTADWRIRPLPNELLSYARSDTHFLLFIYDNMRNELILRSNHDSGTDNKVALVLLRSKEYALQRYQQFTYDAYSGLGRAGVRAFLSKFPEGLDRKGLTVLRRVHKWRDERARQDDEGTNHVLSNYALMNIVRAQPLDTPGLLAVSHPMSDSVKSSAAELLDVIKRAIQEAVHEPDLVQFLARGDLTANASQTRPSEAGLDRFNYTNPRSQNLTIDHLRACTTSLWGNTVTNFQDQQSGTIYSTVSPATPRNDMNGFDFSTKEVLLPVESSAEIYHFTSANVKEVDVSLISAQEVRHSVAEPETSTIMNESTTAERKRKILGQLRNPARKNALPTADPGDAIEYERAISILHGDRSLVRDQAMAKHFPIVDTGAFVPEQRPMPGLGKSMTFGTR